MQLVPVFSVYILCYRVFLGLVRRFLNDLLKCSSVA